MKMPNYVYLLLVAQAVNLITAVLSVTVAPLVGLSLAPDIIYATIPYGLQFFAILISTLFFSRLMDKFGRYNIFLLGTLFLFLAGIIGFLSLKFHNFILLSISQFLLGLFISTANFYRFAATDNLEGELVAKASTMVISGGVIAAIIAPTLAILLQKVQGFPDYSFIYLFLSFLAFFLVIIIIKWKKLYHRYDFHNLCSTDKLFKDSSDVALVKKRHTTKINYKKIVYIGIIGGAVSYFLMNLMMIASSLYLKSHHSFSYASIAIQMHVLAMFLPSFLVSGLIKKLGDSLVIGSGFILIAFSALLPLLFTDSIFINISLIILGVGWNFSYSGATALIGGVQGFDRLKIQGINETVIALFATLGAFLPAPLMNYMGWNSMNIFTLIISTFFFSMILFFIKVSKN